MFGLVFQPQLLLFFQSLYWVNFVVSGNFVSQDWTRFRDFIFNVFSEFVQMIVLRNFTEKSVVIDIWKFDSDLWCRFTVLSVKWAFWQVSSGKIVINCLMVQRQLLKVITEYVSFTWRFFQVCLWISFCFMRIWNAIFYTKAICKVSLSQ
jgi:hypothetical protein